MLLKTYVVGALATNCYVVGSEQTNEVIVIDPGAEGEELAAELQRQGLTAVLIINTHGHFDHTGGVAALKEATGAPYAIHAGDVLLLKQGERARMMDPDFREPPEPDQLLKDGDQLQAGEVTLKVLETPGHTPGSVCLFTEGLVFTGDTLFLMSVGRTDFAGGNHNQLISNIHQKLLTLPDATKVLPGHGPASTIGQERRANPFLLRRSSGLYLP
ncbi:MAG: MBL fold metallo-hydrolase [Chloroflexi bacterium]|nr:MBL fold metallo-hydrolase [Chloroflexota bacterium]